MATVVRLQVRGIEFSDEERIDAIEDRVPEVSFVLSNGVVVAEIVLEGQQRNAFSEATDILHKLKAHDSLILDRVEPLLVNTSDIAGLVGLTRQAVMKWVANPDYSFPREEGCVGAGERPQKIWSLYSVNEWLFDVAKIDLGLELPTPALVRSIDAFLVKETEPVSEEWESLLVTGISAVVKESTAIVRSVPDEEWSEGYWDFSFSAQPIVSGRAERGRRIEVAGKGATS